MTLQIIHIIYFDFSLPNVKGLSSTSVYVDVVEHLSCSCLPVRNIKLTLTSDDDGKGNFNQVLFYFSMRLRRHNTRVELCQILGNLIRSFILDTYHRKPRH